MRASYLLLLIVFISACDDESHGLIDIEGSYEGTFIRSSPYGKYESSQVTLTFSNGQFQGESEITKYPAICNGIYEVKDNNVVFLNACIWTAYFDWTLILSGEFSIEVTANELTLQRRKGSICDLYRLKRK